MQTFLKTRLVKGRVSVSMNNQAEWDVGVMSAQPPAKQNVGSHQRLSIHRYSPWVSAYGFVSGHVLNLSG